jgi:hypothetical protein
MPTMKLRPLLSAAPRRSALRVSRRPRSARSLADLREALRADPAIAAAQASWVATQEKAPRARRLLPNITGGLTGNVSRTT